MDDIFPQAANTGARMLPDPVLSDDLVRLDFRTTEPGCNGLFIDYGFKGRDQKGSIVIDWDWEHSTPDPKTYDSSGTRYVTMAVSQLSKGETFFILPHDRKDNEIFRQYFTSEINSLLYFDIVPLNGESFISGSLKSLSIEFRSSVLYDSGLFKSNNPINGTLCIEHIEFTNTPPPQPSSTPTPTLTPTATTTNTPIPTDIPLPPTPELPTPSGP